MEKCTFIIDIDDTICVTNKIPGTDSFDYANSTPINKVILRIRRLKDEGHDVVLYTARGMRTYNGDLEKINQHVRPVLEDWLARHGVLYDQLIMGKPWGPNVYYVDDKSLSPSDFVNYSTKEYQAFTELKKLKP